MGNYTSWLRGSTNAEDNLTLEKACTLLEHTDHDQKVKELETKPSLNSLENTVSTKFGVITQTIGNKCVIDDTYVFIHDESDFILGSKVRYNLFTSDDTLKVSNVEIINEWDSVDNSESLWSDRVVIHQVEKRMGRKIILSSSNITVDLDKAPIEFLPIVGDWLQLDVKCVVNENTLDLAGEIIEINSISPLRLHIEMGKVTGWKVVEGTGTINNKIFFNKSALSLGYLPALGDKVVAEVIESGQNKCSWRAIKMIPESMSVKLQNLSKTTPDYQESHPELEISDVSLSFEKLSETKSFEIKILNKSDIGFKLNGAEFFDSNRQCKVLNNKCLEILPGHVHKVLCECTSKNLGNVKELLVLKFENVSLGKWINILVSIKDANQRTQYEYNYQLKPHKQSDNEVIRGQRGKSIRFKAAALPQYPVPQKLVDNILEIDSRNFDHMLDQLKIIKPCLVSNLTHLNYEEKFHTLLHLDELANLSAIRVYDQNRVSFVLNGEYLMLEIDNLSERKPSLIVGDKIIATDPLINKGLDYEGFIHKVGAKHVYLKFNKLFHESYNGEDYSIKVIPGRSNYKRLHHAVHLAPRNLGQSLLFPTRISDTDLQVEFVCDTSIVSSPNGTRNKRKDVLSKMQQYKLNSIIDTSEESHNKVKLQWYNEKLNPIQKNAVMHILWGKARPLPYIIFGPPGTGKTVTIIETILQIVRLIPSSRLLVTTPSNSAADLIALRLIDSGVLMPGDLVRVISYNYALSDMIPIKLVPYCATVSDAKEDTVLPELNSTNSRIQFGCTQAVIGRHKITVATCGATGQFLSMGFPKGHFSHIIVDEAAQASEPYVMIPSSFLDKNSGQIILAGDPLQLGPVVLSKVAEECGLNESYLERIINRFPYIQDPEGFPETCGFDPRVVTKLLYSYRALPDILNLYNSLFYSSELIPTLDEDNSAEGELLKSLEEVLPRKTNNNLPQIIFHGVNGENYQSADSPSWYNPHEAAQVFYYVNEFYRLGISSSSLGIITPYIKQVKEIRSILTEAEFDLPRVGTVEEFQGQEFDIIILSTVRSSTSHVSSDIRHGLGFVASPKRLNVAVSRSKSLFIVIGNPNLLCQDSYWRSVVKYCVDKGCYTGCDF